MKTLDAIQVFNDKFQITMGEDVNSPNRYVYTVVKVTNSTTPQISQQLTAKELDVYCELENWEVTVS